MACDEVVVERIRRILAKREGVTEKRMFGGVAFLLNGHMTCGVSTGGVMIRVGPEAYTTALKQKHCRPMDFTGRPLRGFIYVDPPGYRTDAALATWISQGISFTATLPPKSRAGGRRRARMGRR